MSATDTRTDSVAPLRTVMNAVAPRVAQPVPRMTTTSTGAPIRDGVVIVGPSDMCPEG